MEASCGGRLDLHTTRNARDGKSMGASIQSGGSLADPSGAEDTLALLREHEQLEILESGFLLGFPATERWERVLPQFLEANPRQFARAEENRDGLLWLRMTELGD